MSLLRKRKLIVESGEDLLLPGESVATVPVEIGEEFQLVAIASLVPGLVILNPIVANCSKIDVVFLNITNKSIAVEKGQKLICLIQI